ncbi:Ribosomal RNA small subunit methyltransferase G [candidate division SR1 bacterium Aalborg_AAW-1]|nr:Ribosomal RNA small subunit methyltransferase G [candidate division SR1 bacterium Aalborg_AAW-1]
MNERKPLIELFLEINSQLNLSAIRDEEGVYTKHIMDSLELTKVLDLSQYGTLCDVGTGGGFPLLALSKYKNDEGLKLQLIGLDARRKKIDAINQMIEKLELPDTKAVRSRVEDHRQMYDIVTARAVAYADKIIQRCVPLCKKGGIICLYKEVKEEEREDILKQCKKFSLTIEKEHKYRLFEQDIERVIYVLRK